MTGAAERLKEGETSYPDFHLVVAPPEVFEKNEGGEVTDLVSNGSYTVAVRKLEGGSDQVVVWGEAGRLVTPAVYIPRRVTLGDVFDFAGKAGHSSIYFDTYYSSYRNYYIKILGGMASGLSHKESTELQQKVLGMFRNTRHSSLISRQGAIESGLPMDRELISARDMRIKLDTAGEYVLLRQNDASARLYQIGKEGRALGVGEWEVKAIDRNDPGEMVGDYLPEDFRGEHLLFNDKSRRVGKNGVVAVFEAAGNLSLLDEGTKQRLFSMGARDYGIDPADGDTLVAIGADGLKLDSVKVSEVVAKKWEVQEVVLPGVKGEMTEIEFEPNGNFALVVSKQEGRGFMGIYEKSGWKKVKELAGVKGNVTVDGNGNIYFVDSNDRVRMASTNFMAYPMGTTLSELREQRLVRLRERLAELTPEELTRRREEGGEKAGPEAVAKKELDAKLRELFEARLLGAKSVSELTGIVGELEAIKASEGFAEYPEAFSVWEAKVGELINNIKTGEIDEFLRDIAAKLGTAKTLDEVYECEALLGRLVGTRHQVIIRDQRKRVEVDRKIKGVGDAVEKRLAGLEKLLLSKIEEQFGVVGEMVAAAGSAEELAGARNDAEMEKLEELLGRVKDPEKARELREKLRGMVKSKTEELKQTKAQAEAGERFRAAAVIEEIEAAKGEIAAVIEESVKSAEELERWMKGNAQVIRVRAKILGLPGELRQEQGQAFELFLSKVRQDVSMRRKLGISATGGERTVKFGSVEMGVYQPPKAVWQPKVLALAPGSKWGNLTYEDNLGRVFRPELGAVPLDIQDTVTRETIEQYYGDAVEYFNSIARQVPEFNEDWAMSPYYMEKLAELARLLNIQMKQVRGVLIIEGEAGTGKNVLLEMLAHFSNRELSNFACNMQTEEEDITYAFRFDPTRGTYQVDSRVVEAMRTPGMIINLDEINTLPPGVSKMTNPLFDHRRTLFFPEGRKQLKAYPSVLFTATMNPQHYLGTNRLSQEVRSRARIMNMDYPPAVVNGKATADEALIYARYRDALRILAADEFMKAWDFVVNNEKTNGGDRYLAGEAEKDILKINEMLGIAGKIREAYRKFRTGKSPDIIDFDFSIREGIDTVSQLDVFKTVKAAVKDVVLPKIGDPGERERLELLIDQR